MSFLSPVFFIGSISIDSIEGASCFNMGNNFPTGFESFKKHTQGFGSISGDHNDIQGLRSLLRDSNVIDMLNQAEGEDIPEWVKELITAKLSEN